MAQFLLERGEPAFEALHLLRDLRAGGLPTPEELFLGFLSTLDELGSGLTPPASDLVEQLTRPLTRLRRRRGRGRERALDRVAQRVGHARVILGTTLGHRMEAYGETHLRPTAPIAPDAVLTSDPKRAMDLAARLMERPRMSNLSLGLWGYHGERADGRELTVQSIGIGGPSAAVVLGDLAALGVTRAIHAGTAQGLDGSMLGERVVVTRALAGDGVSTALGAADPSASLTRALAGSCIPARVGVIATVDLHQPGDFRRGDWLRAGACAVDLCSSALFSLGATLGVAIASVVLVTSVPGDALDQKGAEKAGLELGEAAAAALGEPG